MRCIVILALLLALAGCAQPLEVPEPGREGQAPSRPSASFASVANVPFLVTSNEPHRFVVDMPAGVVRLHAVLESEQAVHDGAVLTVPGCGDIAVVDGATGLGGREETVAPCEALPGRQTLELRVEDGLLRGQLQLGVDYVPASS